MLLIISAVAGMVLDEVSVQQEIIRYTQDLLGPQSAREVEQVIKNVSREESGLTLATVFGGVTLLFAATGAFAQLQTALNVIWGVTPSRDRTPIVQLIFKRLRSFLTILLLPILLLVSLFISTVFNALGTSLLDILPEGISAPFLWWVHVTIVFLLVTLFFAAIFKILPNAQISWRYVWVGATITSLFFMAGKELIGYYLGHSSVGSVYGVASSLVIFMVWIYISAALFLLGAQLTRSMAEEFGP